MTSKHNIIQIAKFGIVGFSALTCHILSMLLLVEIVKLSPLFANAIAFYLAFIVSLTGHKHWTFANSTKSRSTGIKFFIIALGSGLGSEVIVFIFTKIINYHYLIAVGISLLIIPPLTYIASKFWAFKSDEKDYSVC